ncbi:MAG TPA: hypothetical protein VHE35_18235 [Kofleriaceae bacterium]|nr:hypothetical protein [Kofleriaceae bacterium]
MSRRWPTAALIALAVVVGLAVRLATFTGLIASDDLTHAWAATHVWHDPVEHSMPDGPGSPYTVNARRVGVNLPLAAAAAIAGPRERAFAAVPLVASLLGIVLAAIAAAGLGGARAGVLAAWLTAVLPVDVWQSTIWLQDSIYAAGLAGVLAALVHGETRGRGWAWAVAGLALGYLQYVKESAVLVLAVLVAVGAWRSWRARAVHRGTVWLVAGFAAVQVLAAIYFAVAFGDAGYYVRSWLERQVDVEAAAVARPFPHDVVRLGLYLTWGGALGVGLPVALVPGARWLARSASPPVRLTVGALAALQLAITLHVLRWGAWTMRYLLQLTPLLVLVGAVGLARAWAGGSARARAAMQAAVVAATAAGLLYGHPQHGRFRSELLRGAAAAIAREVPADAPVYDVLGPRPAHYADRAFALLAGPRPGGWSTTATPASVTRGALVYSNLEHHAAPPSPPPGRIIYQGQTRGGRDWLVVYAVGLPPP